METAAFQNPTAQQGSKSYLYLVVAVATVGGFLFGFDTMIFSGAQLFLQDAFSLNATQLGFAGACVILGCLVGTLLAAIISDTFGRKKTMIFAALLFAVSAIGTALPQNIAQFNFFRIVGGVGIGIAMVISPVYIAEISPRRIRGGLVTLNQIVIVTGALLAVIVGWLLAKYVSPEVNWRWMFFSECLPILALAVGLMFIPESPRWLVERAQKENALDILTRINGPEIAAVEVREIHESIELEKEQKSVSYGELFLPGVRTAMIIAIGLAILQQFSGGMPLSMYAPIIFKKAGFTQAEDAIGLTIFIFLWSLLCVFIVLWLVEKVGRRPLLLWGITGMAIGHLLLALCFSLGLTGFYVPVILTLTTGMSNLSISPLGWVVMAEIFPTRIRGRAMGVATFVLYLSAYTTNQVFPPLKEYCEANYGSPAGIFVGLAIICALGVLFMYKMVPETKGKSLEEIANTWLKK